MFDLSPVTFLRCFAHIVLAMLLAVVIYRVMPSGNAVAQAASSMWSSVSGQADPSPQSPQPSGAAQPASPGLTAGTSDFSSTCGRATACPRDPSTSGISSFWLIVAFALGFIPDAAIQFVLQRSGFSFKARYGELDRHTKQVPPTVLDGIDNFIAFRLEEANMFDVQNLAAANPIMLHIESPYGIYQTIDWVAQAQLCTVAGPDRFLLLKTLNIRTIFDLERAVLPGHNGTVPLPMPIHPAPESQLPIVIDKELAVLVGEILLVDSARDKAMRRELDLPDPAFVLRDRKPLSIEMIQHLVMVMVDDLHVHRLRQLWTHIQSKLNQSASVDPDVPRPSPQVGFQK